MNKSKLSLVLLMALVLSLALTAPSFARPWGCGPGGPNLTPEQAGQLFDLKEKFKNDTAPLRRQMWIKRAEMAALWRVENPDQNAILAKQKEMNALREQLQQKMVAHRLEVRKLIPFGPGMGPGMGMGPGCGMGPGGGMAMAPGDDLELGPAAM